MSRVTRNEVQGLMEAYNNVYAPQELTEEQIWEEVETWVNSLLEEGYDLSDYTWEEMYESYVTEVWGALGRAALGALGRGARPVVGGALRQAGKWGTIGGIGLAADELLTRGAGRTAANELLKQTRKLGPALRGEPTGSSDTAKPTPAAPTELKGKQVLAKKGDVEGVLDKDTGEWKAGKWSGEQSKRHKERSTVSASYEYNDAFDLVLEYLLSQGHVDTLEEALYVMMEMSAETIQDIVEVHAPPPIMSPPPVNAPPPVSSKTTSKPANKVNVSGIKDVRKTEVGNPMD